jgi:hypothetical protein
MNRDTNTVHQECQPGFEMSLPVRLYCGVSVLEFRPQTARLSNSSEVTGVSGYKQAVAVGWTSKGLFNANFSPSLAGLQLFPIQAVVSSAWCLLWWPA